MKQMAKIREVIEEENARNKEVVRPEIHLYQEGDFLRAYEWSAWLCCLLLHDLKVTHKQFKGVGTSVVFVGFPQTSLPKWLSSDFEQESLSDKHVKLIFDPAKVPGGNDEFKSWKSSFPVSETQIPASKPVTVREHTVSKQVSLTSVMRRILEYLTAKIILLNPINGCFIKGRKKDWYNLPRSKSLFYSEDGCCLPIGNLTSQLFSNVYLNELDQYMKRILGCGITVDM